MSQEGDTMEELAQDVLQLSPNSAFVPPNPTVTDSIDDKLHTVIEMEQENKVGNLQTSVHRMETKVENLHGRVEGIESNIASVSKPTSVSPIESHTSLIEFM